MNNNHSKTPSIFKDESHTNLGETSKIANIYKLSKSPSKQKIEHNSERSEFEKSKQVVELQMKPMKQLDSNMMNKNTIDYNQHTILTDESYLREHQSSLKPFLNRQDSSQNDISGSRMMENEKQLKEEAVNPLIFHNHNESQNPYETSDQESSYVKKQKDQDTQTKPDGKFGQQVNQMKSKVYTQNIKNKKLSGFANQKEKKTLFQTMSLMKSQNMSTLNGSVKSPLKKAASVSGTSLIQKMQDAFEEQKEKEGSNNDKLRQIFLESYGIEMNLAGYYYDDAKFVPNHSEYIVCASWHIVPEAGNLEVQITNYDRTYKSVEFKDVYKNHGKEIILRLMQPFPETHVFDTVKEIQLKGIRHSIIEFSKDGSLFGIYDHKLKIVRVYDSSNMIQCFEDIEKGKFLWEFEIKKRSFVKAQNIIFDLRNNYLAVVSVTQIIVFQLEKGVSLDGSQEPYQTYSINENYETIFDCIIDSKNPVVQNSRYNCVIACKQDGGRKMIDIYDIADKEELNVRNITYQTNGNKPAGKERIVVKISNDFQQVVFSNGIEHYILKGRSQDFFPQIRDKTVRFAINHDDSFYFTTSKEYDRDIDILNSAHVNFNASITRSLEPGQIQVFDAQIQTTGIDSKLGHLRILMNQGDYLYLDTVEIDLCFKDETRKDAHIMSVTDKMYMAYGFNWPYFCYATKSNFIGILNAFNLNFIQRYQLPPHTVRCHQTFLTDTHDFYCILESDHQTFQIFNIDLDSPEPYLEGPVLEYKNSEVQNKPITNFHVRASSRKEKINLNRSLICFMMHGNTLYGWCEAEGGSVTPVNHFAPDQDKEAFCSNFYYFSDDSIFYMTTVNLQLNSKKKVRKSLIKMVEAQFGTYKVTDVYEDKDSRAEILNFGVDNTNKRLLILTGIKNQKDKRDKFITLYDFDIEKVIFTMQIFNVGTIGRLKSNLYNFVGGHIYYNNKVIKIRYDLLDQVNGQPLKENQVFDHYRDVLFREEHEDGRKVQTGTPLQTCLYNRLAYIVRNQRLLTARKVIILPYLHERRIYLNRRHKANQFYTLVKHQNESNYILCLCIPDNKMYVYSETGILVNRVSYKEIAEAYGKPIEISENGLILIFRKGHDSSEIHLIIVHIDKLEWVQTINVKSKLEKYIINNKNKIDPVAYEDMNTFYNLYLNKLENMKSIDMTFCLNDDAEILVRLKPKGNTDDKERLAKQLAKSATMGVLSEMLGEGAANVFGDQQIEKGTEDSSFFFFFPNSKIEECRANCRTCFGCSKIGQAIENQRGSDEEEPPENEEYIYFDKEDDEITDLKGVSMNQDWIFFWNNGCAWKLSCITQKLSKIGIYVDEREIETFIIQIRTGSNKNRVAIRVTQTKKMDCIIIWDLLKDVEIKSFDVKKDAMFFQDRWGNQYLAENDYIINCAQTCKLKCYRMKVNDFETPQFGFGNGYRVDSEMHNFILMRNYINLSFSYMTFVIKENYDKGGYISEDFLFDPEGYDYVLQRNTVFTEGTLVTQDYDKLNFILKSYEALDPVLLEQLFYKNEDEQTPLHIAVKANNTRMVNLILQFLAKLDNSGISMLKNIFKDLIDYKMFAHYLNFSTFQSIQMINKQTIVLRNANDAEIIKVSPSKSSYVDDHYFETIMGEEQDNSNFQTFAVQVKSVRADWILNEEIGLTFMNEMLRKKNREVFMTPYMQVIIEFLYQAYSMRIMSILLPIYLIHLLFVNLQIVFNEQMRELILDCIGGKNNRSKFECEPEQINKSIKKSSTFVIICGILTLVNIAVFIQQTLVLKLQAFTRVWSIVDFFIILTNTLTVLNIFASHGVKDLKSERAEDQLDGGELFSIKYIRVIECILIVLMWFKSLYYMRLVPEIAPLVESIFVIMNDMLYFLLIFIIGIIAFTEAFWIIGKNQVMLDINRKTPPEYSTLLGALRHVFISSLGDMELGEYTNSEMSWVLAILFILLSFLMCIHLLNMLIAIMGQSFERNNQVADSNKKISQLEFVVNNWWISPIKNKQDIVYFVAAFAVNDDDFKQSKMDLLDKQQKETNKLLVNFYTELKSIQYDISQLSTQKQ